MLVLKDCSRTVNDFVQDLSVEQYAQVCINGIYALEMFYNTHEDCVYANYNENMYEVNASATLKQFLGILLNTDQFTVVICEPYNEQFDSEPLDKTLRNIRTEVDAFQFDIITPM